MVADIDSPREQYLGIHDTDVGFFWGARLISIYNDAYHQKFLGSKHPTAFFQSYRDIWSEISPELRTVVERGWAGQATFLEKRAIRRATARLQGTALGHGFLIHPFSIPVVSRGAGDWYGCDRTGPGRETAGLSACVRRRVAWLDQR